MLIIHLFVNIDLQSILIVFLEILILEENQKKLRLKNQLSWIFYKFLQNFWKI